MSLPWYIYILAWQIIKKHELTSKLGTSLELIKTNKFEPLNKLTTTEEQHYTEEEDRQIQ